MHCTLQAIDAFYTGHHHSQGAEKALPPEVGIETGPLDLKANTLHVPRRFYRKTVEVVLYTYTYFNQTTGNQDAHTFCITAVVITDIS